MRERVVLLTRSSQQTVLARRYVTAGPLRFALQVESRTESGVISADGIEIDAMFLEGYRNH